MKPRPIHLGQRPSGQDFDANLDLVLRLNLLVQANSGGGKSWLLRRMIEQSFTRVPQIIIDPEGEFATLRKNFDVVLVGQGGDTPVDLRSAKLLAHRLLELGASAVIDLYEVSKPIRVQWVAAFISALVDAPKKLWRDLLVYVDEAHELAPEPGHGTERADEKLCRAALIDLAAKGRKRGYGVVAATQRLGKLSKDFAAELKNVLIGQTFIDIDRERAAGALGIAKADKAEFFNNVKNLPPGRFYALGRALSLDTVLVKIGDVQSEHPEPGRRVSAPPPPTKKILHLLPQLSDLPKEAEQKILTEKELKARIAELERELAKKPIAAPPVPQLPINAIRRDLHALEKNVERLGKEFHQAVQTVSNLKMPTTEILGAVRSILKDVDVSATKGVPATRDAYPMRVYTPAANGKLERVRDVNPQESATTDAPPLPDKSQKMLGALKQGEAMGLASMPFRNVAVLAGIAPTSGTTRNRKGQLVHRGLIVSHGDNVQLTPSGRLYPIDVPLPPTSPKELLAFWKAEIGTEKVCKILETVVLEGPIDDQALAAAVGMEMSGTYRNYKGALTRRGLIEKVDGAYVATAVFRR